MITTCRKKRIALLLGQDLGYCRKVLKGIRNYCAGKSDWVTRIASPESRVMGPLKSWNPDGIICHLFRPQVARGILDLNVPTVNTTNTLSLDLPLVDVDHFGVGQMAARYLLSKRFENFGYLGSKTTGFSQGRESGFRQTLQQEGFNLQSCYIEYLPQASLDEQWSHIDSKVISWLERLEKPVAILASNDIPARDLANACIQLQIRIPDEVAILGVDNDEFLCSIGHPPLSSISVPGEQIGFAAAKQLDRLMSEESEQCRSQLIPPTHVVERQSTDIVAISDQLVAQVLKFIRLHFASPIGVGDIARELDTSRRKIERRFRQKVGRTILEEIRSVRITHAKELLANTSESVERVAEQSGFSSGRRFATVFRQSNDMSPSEFRNLCRNPETKMQESNQNF